MKHNIERNNVKIINLLLLLLLLLLLFTII